MRFVSQPIWARCLPDLAEGDCVGSWLNHKVSRSGKDYSTYGNNATTFVDVRKEEVGGYFNGTSSKMGFANDAELNFAGADKEWSVEFWFNASALPGGGHDSICHHNPSWQINIDDQDKLYFWVWGPNKYCRSINAIKAGQFYYGLCVVDTTRTAKMYLNGDLQNTFDATGTVGTPTTGLFIGLRGYNNDQHFPGYVACGNIYNTGKSAGFAKERWNAAIPEG